MSASRTPPPIPAALRSAQPALARPAAAPERPQIHIAIVVPDERLYKALKDRIIVLGPRYQPYDVIAHIVLEDKNHEAAVLSWETRMALAELGLVEPAQVGFAIPKQVTLGWPEEATS